MILIATKIIVGIHILIYFGTSLVVCNNDIPFCRKRLKELREDEKYWSERCVNDKDQILVTPRCEAEKKYNHERICMYTKICFYKGPSAELYLLIKSKSEIHDIDLISLNATVVIRGLAGRKMEIDTVDNNLYIADNNSISRINLDDMCVEVILQNVSVDDMAVDWIQRRLYWAEYSKKMIFEANLDGKNKTVLINTTSYPSSIAMDATWRYLFWTEPIVKFVRGISLAPKYVVMANRTFSEPHAITVDCTKNRVYWLEKEIRSGVDYIVSSQYSGLDQKTIIRGILNDHLLGVLGDSLYFMNNDLFYVNEMNVSNGNISRNILVDNNSNYNDLVVVHRSIQPHERMGSLRKSVILAIERIELHNKLEEWLPRQGYWRICWRGSEHGWATSTFHRKCDGKIPTLTIVQVVKNNTNLVFGGYATRSWGRDRVNQYKYTSAPGSFIFSVRNNDDLAPFKAPLRDENDGAAIYRGSGWGPTFGMSDLVIDDNARSNTWSFTNFGLTYQSPPGYTYDETNTTSLLAGSRRFSASEIETLYLN